MPDDFVFLYGPPASGKSSIGLKLAENLALPFYDLDAEIEIRAGETIPEIFAKEGEAGFRSAESETLNLLLRRSAGVVALGGGALLEPGNRVLAEANGRIVCLEASLETILERLNQSRDGRPLLDGDQKSKLAELLHARQDHYQSFLFHQDTEQLSSGESAWQIQIILGMFRVSGMGGGYQVRVEEGSLRHIGEVLHSLKLDSKNLLVSDENVARYHLRGLLDQLKTGKYEFESIILPAGEEYKTFGTVEELLERFVDSGLDRHSAVLALGGGVVGDLAGFTAAVYLRGVRWIAVPTSLLGMVDASLGGKTGADLPQGKNLVGAFHPPSFVLADPAVLATLPEIELRNGLAEVVKHGVIGDRKLFEQCCLGLDAIRADLGGIIRRAMAVKLRVIEADPFENGRRAVLNFGHTLGHALETASAYQIKHGEAVAIGMVAAARLSERLDVAERGLADEIESCLQNLGLPVRLPENLDRSQVRGLMEVDKKRRTGRQRLVLPETIGTVRWGVEIDDPVELIDVMM